MRILIIDHYSVPIRYYPLARQRNFAKYLMKKGHDVTIICASTVHNSNLNLIKDKRLYLKSNEDGIRYIYIKCHSYNGNGVKRILNMLEFAIKLPSVLRKMEMPDVIISTSMTQFACAQGVRYGKQNKCPVIAQITDLWPETLVSYGIISEKNVITKILRALEKWTYKHADKIVFSMEGAYDYIKTQKWMDIVPVDKLVCINNGIDLDEFNLNRKKWLFKSKYLEDNSKFNIVYIGSIRRVNNVGAILDIAKKIKNSEIRFLIFGDGDELDVLKERVKNEDINNVVFEGRVDKKYIPYIVSCADINYIHNDEVDLFRYGVSFNKIFDCLAAGKPIIVDFIAKYNPVIVENAGVLVKGGAVEVAEIIEKLSKMDKGKYSNLCNNALNAAKKYDFKVLTDRLENAIYETIKMKV